MKKQTGQKEIMKKVLDYIRPQWLLVLISLLMAVVSVALTLYLPVLTGNVVDHILGPGKVEFSAIFEIMRTMAAAIVVTAAAQWIMNVCNNKIVYTVTRNIREEAFAKIEILPLKYLDTHSSDDKDFKDFTDHLYVINGSSTDNMADFTVDLKDSQKGSTVRCHIRFFPNQYTLLPGYIRKHF